MDKTATALDPKLKEVYDRVMGTAGQPAAPIAPATPPILSTPTGTPPPPAANINKPLAPQSPASPAGRLGEVGTPTSASIGLTPPITSTTTPAPTPAPMAGTLPPLPEKPPTPPVTPLGSNPAPPPNTPAQKTTVDYAALAAKYATPMSSVSSTTAPLSTSQTAVTPSGTTYGVVNGGNADKKTQENPTEKGGSSRKKILLIIGIPLFIVAYAAVWIAVFKVDLMSLLPLPK